MHRILTTICFAAIVAIAVPVALRAQTGKQKVMIVAWEQKGYLVTENGGGSWRLVAASEVGSLPENIQALLKTSRSNEVANQTAVVPNPSAGQVSFRYNVSSPGDVAITIYDGHGAEVVRTIAAAAAAGYHSYSVDLSSLPSGAYYYRIANGEGPVGNGTVIITR
ncbi:MAG: T9SS type A sorting domain-containing protein [Bacteroidetes bacterium]|nr:T9SS type A sorting domain-containing protein [Bacteroidota bacterium]